jgi:hypothetical protein
LRRIFYLSAQPRANTINFGASLGVRHVLPVTLAIGSLFCFALFASAANSQSINSPVPVRLHSIIPLASRSVLARCQIPPLLLDTRRVCTAASFCLPGLQTHTEEERKMHARAFHLFCQLAAGRLEQRRRDEPTLITASSDP